ncbi:MAG TPA: arabinan endo-1,5-alpha-L-arabinosidase [Flavisolibacter sp.]|nr:arabinan endo-1,5-alpha-L-arabinosidase [Flavisolibacter sp.]
MKNILVFIFAISVLQASAQQPPAPDSARRRQQVPVGMVLPAQQVSVHDPVMIKQGNTFYLFCTGLGIGVWSSKDLQSWRKEAPVFGKPPKWAVDTIPGFRGHIWAPDISFHNGQYYLYYSVSAFGKNTSAIGLAVNKTLDSSSADFKWVDYGRVIQSYPGKTNWNAIDANLIVDEKGVPYLAFGSFWDGLKMVRLTSDFLHPAEPVENIPTIASRKNASSDNNPPAVDNNPKDAGGNAIEAPFIFKKGAYYYFFASTDYCCKGVKSTYKVIVARSKNISGPYFDKQGKDLRFGGGTLLLEGNKHWYGVGHNGICAADGKDYIVYHGYDAADNGRSKLLIRELVWDENGWPLTKNISAPSPNAQAQ